MIFRYLWPAMAWTIFILVVTLMPGEDLPTVDIVQADKLVHCFVFGLLMLLSAHGLSRINAQKTLKQNPVWIAAIYSTALGILIEFLQTFVPGRNLSVLDIIANTLGVGMGYLAYRLWNKYRT